AVELPQVLLHGRGGRERTADRVVDHLREDVPRGPGDDQTRALRRAEDLLPHPKVSPQPSPRLGIHGLVLTQTGGHRLLTSLSDLLADLLPGVPDALALVRLRLAQFADVGGDLTDHLL